MPTNMSLDFWWLRQESNLLHRELQSRALPVELLNRVAEGEGVEPTSRISPTYCFRGSSARRLRVPSKADGRGIEPLGHVTMPYCFQGSFSRQPRVPSMGGDGRICTYARLAPCTD